MENSMKKLFVGNLPWNLSESELKDYFAQCGDVESIKIVTDAVDKGKSKGFGFVEMKNAEGAQAAIRELNGKPLNGRPLRVSLAQERSPNERREPRGDRESHGSRSNYRSNY
jgi:RNA recognition motif-containing protein